MRPANSGGEGERFPCPVEVLVGGGRGVHRGGGGGGRGGREESLKAGAAAVWWYRRRGGGGWCIRWGGNIGVGGEGRGLWRRCGEGGGIVGEDNTGVGGEVPGGARVWTHSATSVTEVVYMRGPTQRGISQGGDPAGLKLGAGWVEVALSRSQTMGWPHLDDTA
jgi:hypothetical protein